MRDTLVHIDEVSQGSGYDQKLNVAYMPLESKIRIQGAGISTLVLKITLILTLNIMPWLIFSTFGNSDWYTFSKMLLGKWMRTFQLSMAKSEWSSGADDLNMKDGVIPEQTIKVGKQRMDGQHALNYARFRKDDEGDFGRTTSPARGDECDYSANKRPNETVFKDLKHLEKFFALTLDKYSL